MPREYDRTIEKPFDSGVQIRLGITFAADRSVEGRSVTRFAVQLEYRLGDEWVEVVRSDHDPTSEHGHDVTRDGVHLDVYRDGEKHRVESIAGPMDPANALTTAEEYIRDHSKRLTTRFERWHDLNPPPSNGR